ncbi:hypothetical protein O3P69_020426 [Scylla paramamosain]|uniref:Uncharacterized protein n=1 Tax=Scylla paramamosain TaxID=85552 RepID=A0AAW0TL17_SCYPA
MVVTPRAKRDTGWVRTDTRGQSCKGSLVGCLTDSHVLIPAAHLRAIKGRRSRDPWQVVVVVVVVLSPASLGPRGLSVRLFAPPGTRSFKIRQAAPRSQHTSANPSPPYPAPARPFSELPRSDPTRPFSELPRSDPTTIGTLQHSTDRPSRASRTVTLEVPVVRVEGIERTLEIGMEIDTSEKGEGMDCEVKKVEDSNLVFGCLDGEGAN